MKDERIRMKWPINQHTYASALMHNSDVGRIGLSLSLKMTKMA